AGVDVGRQERVHDPAHALHLGTGLVEAAYARDTGPVLLVESAGRAVLLLGGVRGGPDLALEERAPVGLGLDLGGHERAVGPARSLGLDLVPEGDRGEALRIASPLELARGSHADPLAVHEVAAAGAPLGVAFGLFLRRFGLGTRGRGSGQDDYQQNQRLTSSHATSTRAPTPAGGLGSLLQQDICWRRRRNGYSVPSFFSASWACRA